MTEKAAPELRQVTVLGAGSWGTTIAGLIGEKGHAVRLWAREEEVMRAVRDRRENTMFLPGVRLPGNVECTNSVAEALDGSRFVVSVVPSQHVRAVFSEASGSITPEMLVVSASKGIEDSTHLTPSRVIADVVGSENLRGLAVISGPSFAKEVAGKLPTAVTTSSESAETAAEVQEVFSTRYFRVYTNRDTIGVELGGALKNVVAIASGISDGMGLGLNARAALITRGLAEITRLGVELGADPMTFSGLSGMGDLVLTCTGSLSRNYTVGRELGHGTPLKEVTGGMKMVAEGVKTANAAGELAKEKGVLMPITEAVCEVLHGGKAPGDAVYELMTRELREE